MTIPLNPAAPDTSTWNSEDELASLCSADFETYYSDEVSLRKMSPWAYVFHPETAPYLLALEGPDWNWCGDPRDFKEWHRLDGKLLTAHNASFDALVWKRAQQDGIIPADCNPKRWVCTADLVAYLRVYRSLQNAAKVLYGEDVSKDYRHDAKGRTGAELKALPEWAKIVEAGGRDAKWSRRFAVDHLASWPVSEQLFSQWNREASWRGFAVNETETEASRERLDGLVYEYGKSIPWYPDEKALSPIAIRKQGRKEGIKVPASLAKTDPAAQAFYEAYSETVPWVRAVRDFRQANMMLEKVKTLQALVRADGTAPYQSVYFGAHSGRLTAGVKRRTAADESGGAFNLYNLPKGELQGVDLRGLIIPRPGYKFVIADFCLSPDTPVLRSDLSWAPAGDIRVGDELVGFPEDLSGSSQRAHCYQSSRVLRTKTIMRPRVRVTTTRGSVVCSSDHQWVARNPKQARNWVRAADLVPGDRLAWFGPPAVLDPSDPDLQWLTGVIDGEGSLTSSWTRLSDGGRRETRSGLQIGQKEGPVLDKILRVLARLGYVPERTPYKDEASGVVKVTIPAELSKWLVGVARPVRFVPKARAMWEGQRTWSTKSAPVEVLKVEPLEEGPVIAIETTTKTYVAAGMLSHNCQVEARLLLFYSGDVATMDLIREGFNIYEARATQLLGIQDSKGLKKKDPLTYAMVKALVLGAGYMMGFKKFMLAAPVLTGGQYRPTEAQAKLAISTFRDKSPLITQLWRRHQTWLTNSASQKDPTHRVQLASGRWMTYFEPHFETAVHPETGEPRTEIAVSMLKGEPPQKIFAGRIVENIMQATGYDILAGAVPRIERLDKCSVGFTIYDEVVAEVPERDAREYGEEIARIMTTSSPWLEGCPLEVEWNVHDRYTK